MWFYHWILVWREWCLRAVSGQFQAGTTLSKLPTVGIIQTAVKPTGNGEERSCCRQWKVEENGFVVNVFCLMSFLVLGGF